MAQLQQIAEQHETIDPIKGLKQGTARREMAQNIHARGAAKMQVRDDQSAHWRQL